MSLPKGGMKQTQIHRAKDVALAREWELIDVQGPVGEATA